ncbi:YceI family protein [Adhaeribacter rhizoryzae]|uniref:YceI family protein n=1 Tax=Adhaeribacter rhizoryzae TaxID=2607907 RepID=A0A5M6CX29_9BACT|nr:YceI family protein [Adhaeribacter rhizoryzae]KAA5538950.1 YceI family protein [Adhaeribacter rhizoryzae]
MRTTITYADFKNDFFRALFILLAIFGIMAITILSVRGQTPYKLMTGSLIKVSGTSNVHDWNMEASNVTCEANFKMKNGQLQDLNSLHFTLPVNNLKSKDKLMDTRTYKALKAKEYPEISFKLTKASVVTQQKIINATGNLTIAGVTNSVNLQTSYVVNADESITCQGTKSIKMSDFKMKAPSYMMGALKTGNNVTIDIFLKLKKTELLTTKK